MGTTQVQALDRYGVFDVETTGLDPDKNRIIEIAWYVNDMGIEKTGNYLINHSSLKWMNGTPIPPRISEITGITTEMVREHGVTFAKAFAEFWHAVEDFPLIGHNVFRFDLPFVLRDLSRAGIVKTQIYQFSNRQFIDTAALYKGMVMNQPMRPGQRHEEYARVILDTPKWGLKYNLAECCKQLGIEINGDLHRAMTDVMATRDVFNALVQNGVRYE